MFRIGPIKTDWSTAIEHGKNHLVAIHLQRRPGDSAKAPLSRETYRELVLSNLSWLLRHLTVSREDHSYYVG